MSELDETPTVIALKEENREALKYKLSEYETRLGKQCVARPYQPPEVHSAWWARRITKELLDAPDGKLNTFELARRIESEIGNWFDLHYFQNYCAVIDSYANNGVKPRSHRPNSNTRDKR